MSSDPSDPSDQESILEGLSRYSETIIENRYLITKALNENVRHAEGSMSLKDAVYGLEMMLSTQLDEDVSQDLPWLLLNSIIIAGPAEIRQLRDGDLKPELVSYIAEIGMEYQLQISQWRFQQEQGNNYWSNPTSDIVVRPTSNRPGLTHYFDIGDKDTVEIDTSFSTNLSLIEYLLGQQRRLLNMFPEHAKQIEEERIQNLVEEVKAIRQQVEGQPEEDRSE